MGNYNCPYGKTWEVIRELYMDRGVWKLSEGKCENLCVKPCDKVLKQQRHCMIQQSIEKKV